MGQIEKKKIEGAKLKKLRGKILIFFFFFFVKKNLGKNLGAWGPGPPNPNAGPPLDDSFLF